MNDLFWQFITSKAFDIVEKRGYYTITFAINSEHYTLWYCNTVKAQGSLSMIKGLIP